MNYKWALLYFYVIIRFTVKSLIWLIDKGLNGTGGNNHAVSSNRYVICTPWILITGMWN
jgi:hypothetical protein